jgi:hypothetical protein
VGEARLLPGLVRDVAAADGVVWVAGVCLPQARPPQAGFCDRRAAVRIDPATGAPTGALAVSRGGHVDAVSIFGRTLWAWGAQLDDYDDTVLSRADARTGAVSRSTAFPGRFGVPLLPVSATRVWRVDASVGMAVPPSQRTLYAAGRYRRLVAAPAGRLVWLLERRALTPTSATSRLLALDARTGARVGRPIGLGASAKQDEGLAVTRDALWVLMPDEGTVIRVPIPRALQDRR